MQAASLKDRTVGVVHLSSTASHLLELSHMGTDFPGGSAGNESASDAGDTSLIPGWRRSPGEEIGYPLQYSWASLVAQTVKNQPAMRET